MIGKFQGKVKDYGVSETNAGNPQVYVQVQFEHEGAQKELTWYGSFVGGAKEITLRSLLACGLKPQHYGQLVNLRNGAASGMLDLNKVVEIDVHEEPKYDDPSKMATKVKWLNDPNFAPQIQKIDEAKNAQFFGQMRADFEGTLVQLAQKLGLANAQPQMQFNPGQWVQQPQGQQPQGQTTQPHTPPNSWQQSAPAQQGQPLANGYKAPF